MDHEDVSTYDRAGEPGRSLPTSRAGTGGIDLSRWKEYPDVQSGSLWLFDKREGSREHRFGADYHGMFVPQVAYQLLRRFTGMGEWVLDPFAGAGTTLVEARRLGRHAVGIDLNPSAVALTRRALDEHDGPQTTCAEIVTGDARIADITALLRRVGAPEQVQLVVLHPPYHNIIRFSDDPRDLCNASTVEEFLDMFRDCVANVTPVLEPGRHLGLVAGDIYRDGEWITLSHSMMEVVRSAGFRLKADNIKNTVETRAKRGQQALWRYRALRYGLYTFSHEHVYVLQKR
jgi:DNA modification methylase